MQCKREAARLRDYCETPPKTQTKKQTDGQTDKETRPLFVNPVVGSVCQGRPSDRWKKRDAS